MAVAFTITEINCLKISLFTICFGLFNIYICGNNSFGYAICLVSRHSDKTSYVTKPYSLHSSGSHQAKLFLNKTFFVNSIIQIVRFMILC